MSFLEQDGEDNEMYVLWVVTKEGYSDYLRVWMVQIAKEG